MDKLSKLPVFLFSAYAAKEPEVDRAAIYMVEPKSQEKDDQNTKDPLPHSLFFATVYKEDRVANHDVAKQHNYYWD